MAVIVAIPKEIKEGEKRVAMVPSALEKLLKLGAKAKLQHNAGEEIFAEDAAYKNAEVVNTAKELYATGGVVIKVQAPTDEEIEMMAENTILICPLYAHTQPDILKKLCDKNITTFALELIPRISRAQSMDILSSQATVAGYKAVLIAANTARFFFPMFTTAAGTVRPAAVLIIGAGVAGLQAIATAKRLGARVSAYDVRDATKLEIESLGAKFIDTGVTATGEGGYARELTAEEKKQQQEVLAKHIAASDVVITTAGVPGRPAPKIISQAVVETMKPGAVIVDIMAEMGGNCELSKPGENVVHNRVTIVGPKDIYSTLAIHASEMFAKNVINFLTPMIKDGELTLDWEDEVLSKSVVTRDGKVVHEMFNKTKEA